MFRRAVVGLLVGVVAAACGDSGSGEPLPPVEQVLEQSLTAMSEVRSAGFEMSVSGAPVLITGLEFVEATGVYGAPDEGRAVLTVLVSGLTIEVVTISVADRTWVTEPLTGAWTELNPGAGFNPAVLFGEEGWTALLAGALRDPQIHGIEHGRYLITGTAPADRVERLTAGVVSGQAVEIEFSIDRSTGHVVAAEFTTTSPEGDTDWRIRLGPFDEPVDIEPPD